MIYSFTAREGPRAVGLRFRKLDHVNTRSTKGVEIPGFINWRYSNRRDFTSENFSDFYSSSSPKALGFDGARFVSRGETRRFMRVVLEILVKFEKRPIFVFPVVGSDNWNFVAVKYGERAARPTG